MRRSFHPRLINDPFSDPGLFVSLLFQGRALLFDLGELQGISTRDVLKVTQVFVSHTHIDHFIGFDHLLRIRLGREKAVHVFGPPGFFKHVEGRMAGYVWNLVKDSPNDFLLKTTEVHEQRAFTRTYACRDGFKARGDTEEALFSGILLEEPSFRVEATFLDHRIPCLGFSLMESFSVNIVTEDLKEMGLPVGPWLTRFKKTLHEGRDLGSVFRVTWDDGGRVVRERSFVLGELAERIARIHPGQKIAYVTDIIGSTENRRRVIRLAEGADHLFIEAGFLECDRDVARDKHHLTAREAGEWARMAGVKDFTLFHFSPRYRGREEEFRQEAMAAFRQARQTKD
ncbi:MAG: ribonuclease Z [Deltaproteobacteria bacterium]|nr:ribonuclease Z [Deltaproteobacteria bacterium]